MATKSHSFKGKLEYSTNGTDYTALTDVKILKPPNAAKGDTNVTHLESEEGWLEYFSSWKEPGEINFTMYFAKTQFNTVFGSTIFNTLPGAENLYWRINLPLLSGETTPSRINARGYLKSIDWSEMSTESDDALTCPCGIKCSGKPTFTAGT